MASSLPFEIASTIQSASINRAPSPTHDLNPSTSASAKTPVTLQPASDSSFDEKYSYEDEDGIDVGEEVIPYDVLKPLPRRKSFGPLPDLRFEQSYLASIAEAKSNWTVALITVRDQVFMPLLQGLVWNVALVGWKHWNKTAQMSGNSVGARARRWWYGVNNWTVDVKESLRRLGHDAKIAAEMSDFYQNQAFVD